MSLWEYNIGNKQEQKQQQKLIVYKYKLTIIEM